MDCVAGSVCHSACGEKDDDSTVFMARVLEMLNVEIGVTSEFRWDLRSTIIFLPEAVTLFSQLDLPVNLVPALAAWGQY